MPTLVTLRGKKGSLDSPKASQLFTFGPKVQGTALRGSLMVSKIHKKLGKASDMSNLPIVLTQVTKTGNELSLDTPRVATSIHIWP